MRNILISGGSRGIGRAIVEAFVRNGDRVAFIYRSRDDEAAKVAQATGAVAIKADVSDPAEVRRAIAEAEAALGGSIDVLAFCEGLWPKMAKGKPFCGVHLKHLLALCQEVSSHFRFTGLYKSL